MGVHAGLDFGTSNSGVAVYDGAKFRLLPIDTRSPLPEVIKTILYITKDDQRFIGQEAVEQYYRDNVNRQRRYVRKWAGELDFTGAEMHYVRDVYVDVDELKPGRLLQYLKTTLRRSGTAMDYGGTQVFERYYSVADLIQSYLQVLKERAESLLEDEITSVTIGRPVRFASSPQADQLAQQALRQAALSAGFKTVNFELEPVAAALYFEKTLTRPQTVLVFDFGGGTLDIAIMRLGDPKSREIYASGGIDIAGSDFDRTIIEQRLLPFFGAGLVSHEPDILELIQAVPDWMALPELSTPMNRQKLEQAIQNRIAPVQLRRLQSLIFNDLAFTFYDHVEAAKISLSTSGATVIDMDEKGLALWELYTRHQFEEDIKDQKAQIEHVLLQTMADSGMKTGQIEAVVRTGGSSNIPAFTEMLENIFGLDKVIQTNAFSSVVSGLAVHAFEKS
jgi:hypothetical chaperone protein